MIHQGEPGRMFSLRSMLRGNVLGITFSLCEGRSVIRPTMASGLLWRQRRTPESVVTMCYQTTCCSCGKPTWAGPGCGAHIDSTLRSIPMGSRCTCKPRSTAEMLSWNTSPGDGRRRHDHGHGHGHGDADVGLGAEVQLQSLCCSTRILLTVLETAP